LRDRLKAFLRSYLAAVDDRVWIRIAMQSSLEGSDLTRRYIQNHVTRLLGLVVRELRPREGGTDADEPTPLELERAWHLHSTVIYYLIRKHIHRTPVFRQTDELAAMLVDNFLDGVGVPIAH
jgi:hypothetical protein